MLFIHVENVKDEKSNSKLTKSSWSFWIISVEQFFFETRLKVRKWHKLKFWNRQFPIFMSYKYRVSSFKIIVFNLSLKELMTYSSFFLFVFCFFLKTSKFSSTNCSTKKQKQLPTVPWSLTWSTEAIAPSYDFSCCYQSWCTAFYANFPSS